MKNAFITGISSGFGLALADYLSENGIHVYGCSRRFPPQKILERSTISFLGIDLSELSVLTEKMKLLIDAEQNIDLVVLNAGDHGYFGDLNQTPLEKVLPVFNLNVWVNKVIMDVLIHQKKHVDQIIMMSSGASVNGNRGWNAYALSKACLNMLARLYSHEMPDTHILSIAPGLINTPMLSGIIESSDSKTFPSLKVIKDKMDNNEVLSPIYVAKRLATIAKELKDKYNSGQFIDIRELIAK